VKNKLIETLANFATSGVTATQLFPLFWKAVGICETSCRLKIVATTCDGASPNRKMFRMHFQMERDEDSNPNVDVCYRTRNLYSKDGRFIYFIADPPHLLKTVRNCLYNSGAGTFTRFMWNDGLNVLWKHISDIFYEDRECGLHYLTKLTENHIKLTPFSIMNVRLAAQVLSLSMSNTLREYGPPEATSTAELCLMMDKFFDTVNIRGTDESSRELKPFRAAFRSKDDFRLSWLKDVFLKFFQDWLISTQNRPGHFTQKQRSNMFIAYQSYEGLKITAHSMIEIIPFLLTNKVSYVLTERFSQDPLENYFGHQRSMGSRKDNPTMRDFGYNDNTIRNLKVFRPIAGSNVCADQPAITIDTDPVPCRKRKKKIPRDQH